ncbi:MAG: hypothetical protein K6F00_07280 [Lachnospiraceae bacterium]|nr:hypothetical protein [Lachnospiraceae bacterium]
MILNKDINDVNLEEVDTEAIRFLTAELLLDTEKRKRFSDKTPEVRQSLTIHEISTLYILDYNVGDPKMDAALELLKIIRTSTLRLYIFDLDFMGVKINNNADKTTFVINLCEELQDPKYNDLHLGALVAAGKRVIEIPQEELQLAEAAITAAKKNTPHILSIKKNDEFKQPIDALGKRIFNLNENNSLVRENDKGNIFVGGNVDVANKRERRNDEEIKILYSIEFKEAKEKNITIKNVWNRLSAFEQRVYNAIGNLYFNGNEIISAREIAGLIGKDTKPNNNQIKKILERVKKLMGIVVTIDNTDETGRRYDTYSNRTFNILYASFYEDRPVYINGKLVNNPICIYQTPGLFEFALNRNNYITYNKNLLKLGIRQTDTMIRLQDYLLQEIARIKAGKRNNKMLLSTICKECDITGKNAPERALDTIKECLEYWMSEACGNYIKGYSVPETKTVKGIKKKIPISEKYIKIFYDK